MLVGLLIIASIVIAVITFISRNGGFKFPWFQFYIKGKESGFRFQEVNLLRKVAVENRLNNPTSLFWSEKQLDRCIKATIIRFRSSGLEKNEESIDFLSKFRLSGNQLKKEQSRNKPK
jgi:hypothetical protein